MNSPALSDTLVACSQVVRYLGFGNLLSGVAGVVMGQLEGFMRLRSMVVRYLGFGNLLSGVAGVVMGQLEAFMRLNY
ncbi:hypothetical protein Hanom_Chr06g00528571 [Helianthus anomalus]